MHSFTAGCIVSLHNLTADAFTAGCIVVVVDWVVTIKTDPSGNINRGPSTHLRTANPHQKLERGIYRIFRCDKGCTAVSCQELEHEEPRVYIPCT